MGLLEFQIARVSSNFWMIAAVLFSLSCSFTVTLGEDMFDFSNNALPGRKIFCVPEVAGRGLLDFSGEALVLEEFILFDLVKIHRVGDFFALIKRFFKGANFLPSFR